MLSNCVSYTVREYPWDQVRCQDRDEFWVQACTHVWHVVKAEVKAQVSDQVRNSVRRQTFDLYSGDQTQRDSNAK